MAPQCSPLTLSFTHTLKPVPAWCMAQTRSQTHYHNRHYNEKTSKEHSTALVIVVLQGKKKKKENVHRQHRGSLTSAWKRKKKSSSTVLWILWILPDCFTNFFLCESLFLKAICLFSAWRRKVRKRKGSVGVDGQRSTIYVSHTLRWDHSLVTDDVTDWLPSHQLWAQFQAEQLEDRE